MILILFYVDLLKLIKIIGGDDFNVDDCAASVNSFECIDNVDSNKWKLVYGESIAWKMNETVKNDVDTSNADYQRKMTVNIKRYGTLMCLICLICLIFTICIDLNT